MYIILILDDDLFKFMKECTPSSLDAEFRMLPPSSLAQFLSALEIGIKSKFDFELFQAYLLAFLRIHGDSLSGMKELGSICETINSLWGMIESDFMYTLCMIDFARRAQF